MWNIIQLDKLKDFGEFKDVYCNYEIESGSLAWGLNKCKTVLIPN